VTGSLLALLVHIECSQINDVPIGALSITSRRHLFV
jgi:hypothetical protein